MKTVVRLAMAVGALLLISSAAFAGAPCDLELCYNVAITKDDGHVTNRTWKACLYNDGTGTVCDTMGGCVNLALFGGGPGWFNQTGSPAFGGNPTWTAWLSVHGATPSLYLQPQGAGGALLTGIGDAAGSPWTIKGTKVPLPNPICEL
jgi:hypothetical protein